MQTSADVSHQRVLILRAQTDVLVRALGNIKVYLSEMPPSPHSDVMRALLVKASADLLRLAGPDESEDAA